MATSLTGNVPSPCLSLPPSSEVTPDIDAQTLRSFTTERQAHHQAEQAHEEKLRQRGARIRAANVAVRAYMHESGTRDYSRAFGYVQRTQPKLFAQMQMPAHCRRVANSDEQARQERLHRRWERIQAANDAVDMYVRESGTRDYPAAFTHILRTRPDLFAGVQDPSGVVAAANFNPYHDKLGRFTTRDGVNSPEQSKLVAYTTPEDASESGDKGPSDEDEEDEKDRPMLPAPSVFERLTSVLGIKGASRRDPQGVRRKNHHVVPVQILQENNLSKDIIAELEKLKILPGLPHGWSTAHNVYNERAREITAQFVKLMKTVKSDSAILSGSEAKEFAENLAKQVSADPYCKKFNEMVKKGATKDELNAMLAGAERLVKAKPALLGKFLKGSGTLMKKVDALLGPIGDIANLAFVLSDAYENGPNQATINFFKAATFYDVTAEPLLQGTVKAMDGLLNWGGPEADNPMHMKALMKNMDEQSSSKW